ncbi:hypothetical protein L2E82_08111 [Cichorium intybus]|uniref:Uncharacterized protein n=1 Tax=Cichorium intybus TaxID=13427 RepID=A0ACB9G6P1_CICIN|nr:hypothetical protein L2E82_08111 [Cichorium intybus]
MKVGIVDDMVVMMSMAIKKVETMVMMSLEIKKLEMAVLTWRGLVQISRSSADARSMPFKIPSIRIPTVSSIVTVMSQEPSTSCLDAPVVYQNYKIMPRQPLPNQFVTITAQGKKDPNQTRGVDPPASIFYGEYLNTGPGAGVKWDGYKSSLTSSDASRNPVRPLNALALSIAILILNALALGIAIFERKLKVKVVSPSPKLLLIESTKDLFHHRNLLTAKGMVWLTKIPFLTLLLIYLGSQVKSDASDHRYSEGDTVPFYANKIGPFSNARETYAYYNLPFCSPDTVKEKKLNLGEMLNGDRLVSTPYKLEYHVDKKIEVLCNKTLSKSDVSQFKRVIEKDYYIQFYYDDLPIWAFIGMLKKDHFSKTIKTEYHLYKHFDFEVLYNKDHVIEVSLRTHLNSYADITDDKEVDVGFTYSVKWSVTEQSFDRRMEKYTYSSILPHHMSIQHHSITYSSVALLILIIFLVTFYVLVLSKDISKNLADVEEDQVANNQEETGWKNIHGDVFRFPQHKSLFAAALGVGSQLLVLIVAILALGLVGFFQPYIRGVLWNALIIVYAVTSVVSGYTSVSFYSQLEGTKWMKNLFLTGGLYFGPLFLTFTFLDIVAMFYGTTTALPLKAIVMLSLLWTFLASPLLFLGGIIGKTRNSDFQAPCKTAKIPREVPKLRWYRGVLPQMALAGVLPFSVIYTQLYYIFASVWGHRIYTLYSVMSIVFFLLVIMTALVSVAVTYFQLAVEDHRWWWRSFFCGGSTGLYIYVYCIYYYFMRSDMTGFMQVSIFFGYMACVCFGVFLVLGSVGFRASLLFVRYLYAAIKCD